MRKRFDQRLRLGVVPIDIFLGYLEKHIDLIDRLLLKGEVSELADIIIMPKRGKLNRQEQEESSGTFRKLRNAHSAIESDINCLEHHGLDRCPDKGLENYKRYVGLGVLAYNMHKICNALLGKTWGKKKRPKAA